MKRLLVTISILVWGMLCALSISNNNLFNINNTSLRVELVGEQRTGNFSYAPVSFTPVCYSYPDSSVIVYSAPELQLRLCLKPSTAFGIEAWQATATAFFNTEIYLRQLYFRLDFADPANVTCYKGVQAINSQDTALNTNITPYSDKVVQHKSKYGSFWLMASNIAGCAEVEGLSADTINLYDHQLHFYRRYRSSTSAADLPRDTMYKAAGATHNWSFVIFERQPLLLGLNRWPTGKKAALCITNDSDSESNNRLSAVYLGSNNHDSPKYNTQGFIPNGIKVSNTVFGANYNEMHEMWTTIHNAGNTIGYHTYAGTVDPEGANAQALLSELVPYNVRLWVDHNIPQNPEDLGWNGLNIGSENYVGDIINQSAIEYAWFNDTPPTNPFDAYDDPWRLPHLIYEATALTKPVWFFGRSRTEVWEYTNGNYMLDMKHGLTAQNIEQLLADNGLHISYTHFGASWSGVVPFFVITDTGDYEIRDEVENMLQMLVYYRDYRGLWIDTLESIFDRMLAIEQVKIQSVIPTELPNQYLLTLRNDSAIDIADFSFKHLDAQYDIELFEAGSSRQFVLNHQPYHHSVPPVPEYLLSYNSGDIRLEDKLQAIAAGTTVTIYNLRGQLTTQFSNIHNTNVLHIPFTGYASGVYFAKINTPDALPRVLKFTVLK